MNDETISIGGRKVPVEHKKLNIFELKFYFENPRIASIIDKNKEKVSEDFIDEKLWENNETHKLKRRIEQHGGLIHPIIVYNGYVLEGNTRLCAFRHLFKETNEEKWKYIDCTVINGKIEKKEINSLLADEHIIGKIKWGTYEKGCWMTTMKEREGYDWGELEKIVGKSRIWIEEQIQAYKWMVEANIEDKSKFSHLVQSVAVVKKLKNKDPEIKKKLITAIKNDQFDDAKDIRKVPILFAHKKSRNRLFVEGEKSEQIYHDLKAISPSIDSPLMRAVEDTTNRLRNMSRVERESIKSDNRELDKIKKLTKEIIKLCKELKLNVHNICN